MCAAFQLQSYDGFTFGFQKAPIAMRPGVRRANTCGGSRGMDGVSRKPGHWQFPTGHTDIYIYIYITYNATSTIFSKQQFKNISINTKMLQHKLKHAKETWNSVGPLTIKHGINNKGFKLTLRNKQPNITWKQRACTHTTYQNTKYKKHTPNTLKS